MYGIYPFLSKNGFFWNRENPRTHTIMSGGTLYVSEEAYDDFLGVYAKEIQKGNKTLTFSEIRSPSVFRMYFDIDLLDTKAVDDESSTSMVKIIQNTLKKFFPRHTDTDIFKCVICSTATKRVRVDKDEDEETEKEQGQERVGPKYYTKNGYHVIFPFLCVTLDMALQLRCGVVRDLERQLGKREIATNPWLDVVDKAPYYNGLKMCGSVKTLTCEECGGKKKNVRKKPEVIAILKQIKTIRRKLYPRKNDPLFDYSNVMSIEKDEFKNEDLAELYSDYLEKTGFLVCPSCGDKGWHLEDRYYMPTNILDGDGLSSETDLDYLNNNMHEAMRWTSIRSRPSDKAAEGFVVPFGYASPTSERATASLQSAGEHLRQLSPGIYRDAINSEMLATDAIGIKTWKGDEILDKSILEMITYHVRNYQETYNELDVRQVFIMHVAKSFCPSILSRSNDRGGYSTNSQTSTTTTTTTIAPAPAARNRSSARKGNKTLGNILVANKVSSTSDRVVQVTSRVLVRVSGKGSQYCLNKGGDHTSNSIYFWICPDGIAHKCFSRKDRIGTSGKVCKDFRSFLKPLGSSLKNALFGGPTGKEKNERIQKQKPNLGLIVNDAVSNGGANVSALGKTDTIADPGAAATNTLEKRGKGRSSRGDLCNKKKKMKCANKWGTVCPNI